MVLQKNFVKLLQLAFEMRDDRTFSALNIQLQKSKTLVANYSLNVHATHL